MLHLGDVSKIRGCVVAPVDVVIGGSPCQDLSIAGKRAGLGGGQRSGLFMEQIRIIKEMRHRYGANHPRWMVWENVPGAFSSNGGEDFRIVIEETARIAEPDAAVPRPENGKWTNAGCIMGDGWSLAWRVHDAQFWGVPQRRRRIALVADFGGHAAPEVLFERKGLRWDSSESGTEGQGTAAGIETSPGSTISFHERAGCEGGGKGILIQIDKVGTISCNNDQAVYDARGNGNGETVPTITGDHENRVTDYTAIVFWQQGFGDCKPSEVCSSVKARDWKDATDLVCAAVDCRNGVENAEVNGTLQAKSTGGSSINLNNVVREAGTVRRLTPVECERLQGFPDNWTDIGDWTDSKGKTHQTSDAARYKALGNSIALPFWLWLTKRISAQYERDATMASLFDGLGGFPLVWERVSGKGSCKWASEVDEFCIAVTKRRFKEW